MKVSGNRMYAMLKKMDFIRLSTTKGEKDGAQVICDEIRAMGLEPVTETFKAPNYEILTAKFEVLEPAYKEYTVTGYGRSGDTPADGLTAEFAYVETAQDIDLIDAKGKIVLLSNGAGYETYEKLVKAGVAGFIGTSGNFYDDTKRWDLDERMLREPHTKHGKIPGVCMRMADAIKLVNSKPKKVKITLKQNEGEGDSQNVITEIKGTKYPDEVIVYTAHYDSVVFSKGIFDNAAGSAIIAEICRLFAKQPPLRTMRFVWCGSEERGLLGSKDYVARHENELEKIVMCVNVDLAGPVIGRDTAIVTADSELCTAIEYLYKEIGHPMDVRQDTYSSDSIPFADAGVPGVNFVRFASAGAAGCHTRYDDLTPISAASLEYTAGFVAEFSNRMANAYMFPLKRQIPDNIKDKIDKYLLKTPKK